MYVYIYICIYIYVCVCVCACVCMCVCAYARIYSLYLKRHFSFTSSKRRSSSSEMFLKFLQNPEENTYARFSFLTKFRAKSTGKYLC